MWRRVALRRFTRVAAVGITHARPWVGVRSGGAVTSSTSFSVASWPRASSTASSIRQSLRRIADAMRRKDIPAEGKAELVALARDVARTDARGDFLLARMYVRGWGVDKDINTAIDHYEAAGETLPHAQLAVGLLYLREGDIEADAHRQARDEAGLLNLAGDDEAARGPLHARMQEHVEFLERVESGELEEGDQARIDASRQVIPELLQAQRQRRLDERRRREETLQGRGARGDEEVASEESVPLHAALHMHGVEWLTRCSRGDDTPVKWEAMAHLGECFLVGKGVARDLERGMRLLLEAAPHNGTACFHLGSMFVEGKGVTQDFDEGVRWMHKASDGNSAPAQFWLGHAYVMGNSVDKDATRGLFLLERAATRGHAGAAHLLSQLWRAGDATGGVDEERAHEYLHQAARANHAEALFDLADTYYHGKHGVDMDKSRAFQWYRQAAAQGHTDALCSLGAMYYHGEGADRDVDAAFNVYSLAAMMNNVDAMRNLASMYMAGEGCIQSEQTAAYFLQLVEKIESGEMVVVDPSKC